MSTESQVIAALLNNIERANRKHPALTDDYLMVGPLTMEYDEVKVEVQKRDANGVYRELIDLATVCMRRCKEILEEKRQAGYTYPELEE